MAWFVNENQLTQEIILEFINSLGAFFPELFTLRAMAKQGAEPRAIGSKISTVLQNIQVEHTAELEKQRVSFMTLLTETRKERDYWRDLHDRDLLKEVKDELTTTKALLAEQARKTEAANKEIAELNKTLTLERKQASDQEMQTQRFVEEQNSVIAAQHQKLVRLLGDD